MPPVLCSDWIFETQGVCQRGAALMSSAKSFRWLSPLRSACLSENEKFDRTPRGTEMPVRQPRTRAVAGPDADDDSELQSAELIAAALGGDQAAWTDIVRRYTTLVHHVVRRYRLSHSDSDDVCQAVWIRLWQHLDGIREPRSLPGWIATTTRNEACRVAVSNRRTVPVDPLEIAQFKRLNQGDEPVGSLLRFERHQALRNGLAELESKHRKLLILLHAEPQLPYHEISRLLGIPTGSIGPTRARTLAKLRATSSVTQWIGAEGETVDRSTA